MREIAPKELAKVEKLIGMYGKAGSGFSVGESLTWADLYIYEVTDVIQKKNVNVLNGFDGIKSVRKSVESNPIIRDYIKTRPETSF